MPFKRIDEDALNEIERTSKRQLNRYDMDMPGDLPRYKTNAFLRRKMTAEHGGREFDVDHASDDTPSDIFVERGPMHNALGKPSYERYKVLRHSVLDDMNEEARSNIRYGGNSNPLSREKRYMTERK